MRTAVRRLLGSAAIVAALAAPLSASAQTPITTPDATAQAFGDPTPPAAPLHPFYASLSVLNTPVSAGPPRGRLAITNLTLTNFDSAAQQVFIFVPIFATGGKCGSAVTGGTSPRMQIYVQPSQTLVIPYPTPLVVADGRPNCIAAEVTTILHGGSVEMEVNGFFQ